MEQKKRVMPWILKLLKPWIPALIFLVLCNVASALFSVWFALGSKSVVDAAQKGESQEFFQACFKQGALIVGMLVNYVLIHALKDWLTAVIDRDLKKKFLHGLLRGEFSQVSKYHTGDLLSHMNHDVQIIISSVLSILPSIAAMATGLVSAISVLITIEPKLTYVIVAGGIFVVIVTGIIRRGLRDLNKRVSRAQGKVSGFIQETLEKLLMVQAMDISRIMEKRADRLLKERYDLHRKRKNIAIISHTCMNILAYGSSFGGLVFCAAGILKGTMTYGTLIAVTQLISQVRGPFTNMSGIAPQYAALCASAERLMELDEVCNTEDTSRKDPEELYSKMTAIRAENLTFAYDRDLVFDHANFSLPKGSFGVIVGHSGIGKSTLLKLLLGIFPPKEGSLLLETEDETVVVNSTTRKLFAYIPQGNLLLSGTLRENLLVANENATEEDINRAIYISAMDDYLPSLPQGLDTVVGENALGLSEGQAQRLSIARAILSDAPILLLDEATSALDDPTEKLVLSRISQLPGKTCIAVTHREAATQIADWSLEMRQGQCVVTFKNT